LGWQAKVERISAIDALQFNGSYPATYTPKKWGAHWQLKPSEIACFESHKKVWTQFLASDAEVAVIFEDDVLIASTLQTKLESLSACPQAFDMVKLDFSPGMRQWGPMHSLNGVETRKIIQVLCSAAGYCLSRSGAQKLLALAKTYCDKLDDFITRPYENFQSWQIIPAQAIQGMFASPEKAKNMPSIVSTSERTQNITINKISKGPAPYRIFKELSRANHKLALKLNMKRLYAAGGSYEILAIQDDIR
jgi:GR25 family glycosyltransferase involved in LPS biosynthesis